MSCSCGEIQRECDQATTRIARVYLAPCRINWWLHLELRYDFMACCGEGREVQVVSEIREFTASPWGGFGGWRRWADLVELEVLKG